MKLRPDYKKVLARTKAFIESTRPGSAIIQTRKIAGFPTGAPKPMNQWDFPREMIPYLDARAAAHMRFWEHRAELDDDLLPSLAPMYGIAEHAAFLGGAVEFTDVTSFIHPVLPDWTDGLDRLKLDPNHPWLRMVIDGIRHCREKWGDLMAARLRGAHAPLEFANALRGNDVFTDIYEHPGELRKLLDFCVEAARFTLDLQLREATRIDGGVICGYDVWLPEPCCGHISDDASCLVSTATYEEFGLPHLRKLCAHYETVFLHMHALGKKNLPQFATIPQIKWIQITSDPNSDRAIDVYREYENVLRGRVVVVEISHKELQANLDLLKRNKTCIWLETTTLEAAKESVALVRRELP